MKMRTLVIGLAAATFSLTAMAQQPIVIKL